MGRFSLLAVGVASTVAAFDVPTLPVVPAENEVVILMSMPYIGMKMPLRVLTSATVQRIEYYDGLEVDTSSANGTHKYVFRNGERACLFTPPTSGPTLGALSGPKWQPLSFYPDLAKYKYAGQELVGGIMCEKYTLDAPHGSAGTMDDHVSFYWDAVLGKPVRWHMHSRHVTFGSHTDEYVMDYLSFQPGAPAEAELRLPKECQERPRAADVSIQIHSFLEAAHAMRAAPTGSAPLRFDAFLGQYGKAYAAMEHAHRRSLFEHNARMVSELNSQHAGRASFRGNQFLDMTAAEVLRFRGGKTRGTSREARRAPEHRQYVRVHAAPANGAPAPPKDFDWRTARPGVVSPVKDQAMCGSCWTYGVTEPAESIQAIRTGKLVVLPEQFVVDCAWTNNTGESGMNSGCDGGDSDVGALEIVRKFGGVVPTAASYGSYLSVNGFCKDTRLMQVGARLTGWVDVPKRQEQALMQALYTVGPLYVGIMVPEEMLFYDSGVLQVESCRYNASEIDHAVVSTGFGTDEHGVAYWTIRNSWSTYWGDQGYIKIARGDLDCCVSCEAGYPELELAATAEKDVLV